MVAIREMAMAKVKRIIDREGDLDGFRLTSEYLSMIEQEIKEALEIQERTLIYFD